MKGKTIDENIEKEKRNIKIKRDKDKRRRICDETFQRKKELEIEKKSL